MKYDKEKERERRRAFYEKYAQEHGIHYSTARYHRIKEEEKAKDEELNRCKRYGCANEREPGAKHCGKCLIALRLNNRGLGHLVQEAIRAFRKQQATCPDCGCMIETFSTNYLPTKNSFYDPERGLWTCKKCKNKTE